MLQQDSIQTCNEKKIYKLFSLDLTKYDLPIVLSLTLLLTLASIYAIHYIIKIYDDQTKEILTISVLAVLIVVYSAIIFFIRKRLLFIIRENEKKNLQITDQLGRINKSDLHLSSVEQKYRKLYDQSPDLLRTVDTDGIITDCNESYARKLGFSKNEVIGKSIYEHISLDSTDSLRMEFLSWKYRGISDNVEFNLKRKDGITFPVLSSSTTIYDEKGKLVGSNTVMKDITELNEARKKIQDNEKLILLQIAELKEKDRLKEEFSSMVSHELKTPLVPIKGYTEMLYRPNLLGPLNQAQLNAVNSIHQATERLETLIMNLLDVHKLDIGELKFSKETIDVNDFMAKIYWNFKPLMTSKRIIFTNSTKEKMKIVGDSFRLNQVLSNLIQNSVAFVPKENATIEIGAQDKDENVLFWVKDNGSGIPKSKHAYLFQKFYQVDTSDRRAHRGTGLGLSSCKAIVEKHYGTIQVDSVCGKGTKFTIKLPKNQLKLHLKI